jgi:signal transduction histidine kinase
VAAALARIEHGSVSSVRQELQLVLDRLESIAWEDEDRSAPLSVPATHIDALRTELLAELSDDRHAVDGRELVTLIKAFDELKDGPATAPRPAGFAERLASADAMEAVIEIAHDMRSPLSSILFLVDTIRRGQSGPVNLVQERQLGLIYGAAFGLSTLASDAIDAVRGHHLLDDPPGPFSVTETMLSVCAIVRPIGEEKGLPLHQTFPLRDGRIGYAAAIGRVLLNLTSNALKYTERGSVSIGCSELSEKTVEFWVSDTGAGIPDKVLSMLFDGFRPGSVGMRFSSAGLGLAICRALLEAMGSTLTVETELNKGTRFSFQLDLPVVE